MKHAGPATLQTLAPLLARLRALPGLTERTPGCFYRGSKAFLHFHEDPSGLHADVRLGAAWERVRVETRAERQTLLSRLGEALSKG